MKLKQKTALVALFVMVFSLFTSVLSFTHTPVAWADSYTPTTQQDVQGATASWVNAALINLNIGGHTIPLTANLSESSSNHGYNAASGTSRCTMRVYGNTAAPTKLTLDIQIFPSNATQGNCQAVSLPNHAQIVAGNPAGAAYVYNWQDNDTIVRTDGNSSWTFINSGHKNSQGSLIFLRSSEAGKQCQDTMLVSPDNTSETLWVMDSNQGDRPLSGNEESLLGIVNHSCWVYGYDGGGGQDIGAKAMIGNLQNATKQGGGTSSNGAVNGPGGTTTQPSCETTGFSLAWIMCKVMEGVANAIDFLYSSLIEPLLKTPPLTTSSTSGQTIYKAWSTFRVFGDIFLVIALLVIIFGEAMGGGG